MRRRTSPITRLAVWLVATGLPMHALAQDDAPPPEEPMFEAPMDADPAASTEPPPEEGATTSTEGGSSSSSSRVSGPRGATGAFSESAGARSESPNNVLWTLAVGGTLSYGNSRTGNATVSTSLQLRDGSDVGVIEASFLYGVGQTPLTCGTVLSRPTDFPQGTQDFCMPPGGTAMGSGARAPGFNNWTEFAVNLQWRARWDHYFDAENALFVAHTGRADRFAGLLPRLGLQVGWDHILFRERNHSLAFDLGVDGTLDLFTDSIRLQVARQVAMGASIPPLWGTDARFMPQVLLRIVYVNHLTNLLTYDTTFEAYWDVVDYTHLRFQWVNHFRTQIDSVFQLRLDVTGRFDSQPPGQAVAWNELPDSQTATMFELVTTLNVQGTFDLDGVPPPVETAEGEGHGGGHGSGHGADGGGGGSGSGGGGSRCTAGQSCLSTSGRSSSSGGSGGGREGSTDRGSSDRGRGSSDRGHGSSDRGGRSGGRGGRGTSESDSGGSETGSDTSPPTDEDEPY